MFKDHVAPKRKLSGGIRAAEKLIGSHQGTDGIPTFGESVEGDGIPVESLGRYRVKGQTQNCKGKEGACKAHRVRGEDYCVGHLKQLAAQRDSVGGADADSDRV